MKYIKEFENNFSEYKYYVAIYRCDCNSEDDMLMKANLVKDFLRMQKQSDFKICYIDSTFPDSSEAIVFLLKKKINDIKFPYPTEGSAKDPIRQFTIFVREVRNWKIIEKTEIPNNDLEEFFTAKRYNL